MTGTIPLGDSTELEASVDFVVHPLGARLAPLFVLLLLLPRLVMRSRWSCASFYGECSRFLFILLADFMQGTFYNSKGLEIREKWGVENVDLWR